MSIRLLSFKEMIDIPLKKQYATNKKSKINNYNLLVVLIRNKTRNNKILQFNN